MSEENGETKFGFKDKAKAEETLQLLESHDMQYRKLTVRGLLGRAKRVLSSELQLYVRDTRNSLYHFHKLIMSSSQWYANKSHNFEYLQLSNVYLHRFHHDLSFSVTKAEDKIKNINEAIEVFAKWLDVHGGGSNKSAKPENNDKADTVPGLGFKDKEAAEKTLK